MQRVKNAREMPEHERGRQAIFRRVGNLDALKFDEVTNAACFLVKMTRDEPIYRRKFFANNSVFILTSPVTTASNKLSVV